MESNFDKPKGLSLPLAVVLGINAVVGAGIFSMPLVLIKTAGPAGMITICLATMCVLFIALAFARISFLLPEKGGFYSYVSAWAGSRVGVFASCMYIVGMTVALGLLVRVVSGYLGVYITGVHVDYVGYSLIICTIVATWFASSLAAAGQIILFTLTLAPLFLIMYLCAKQGTIENFHPFITQGWQGVLRGMPTVLFSFLGFESISSLSRKISNPEKTIPLATILTIVCVSILYIVFVGTIIAGIPTAILAQKTVFSEALLYSMPEATWLIHCINFAIIVTILGTVYSVMWSLSELLNTTYSYVSMKEQGISNTLGVLLIGAGMFLSMKFFVSIMKIFSVVALCVVFAYALTTIYLLICPKRFFDKILGVLALISCLLFFVSACAQLI